MYKLLFDSDALIKVSKADFLDVASKSFSVLITEEIYDEAVKEGKRRLFPDADEIENLVQQERIKILKKEYYKKRKIPKQLFGKGEISAFQAHTKKNTIVTDDLNFRSYIKKEHGRCLSSAHILYILAKKGKLSKSKAYDCLERLRPYIRKEVYKLIKEDIGELK